MIEIIKILLALVWFFGGVLLIFWGALTFNASPLLGGGVCACGIILFLSFLAFAVD